MAWHQYPAAFSESSKHQIVLCIARKKFEGTIQAMRTTVTLDPDVEKLIRDEMHRTRQSFKKTLNDAIREALGKSDLPSNQAKFVVKSRPMGLLPGIDPANLAHLASDIEVDRFRRTTHRIHEKLK